MTQAFILFGLAILIFIIFHIFTARIKPVWRYIFGWHWFFRSWYQYLFQKADDPTFTTWYNRLWCRINGHPHGTIYYNINGTEPDCRCKECGDEL